MAKPAQASKTATPPQRKRVSRNRKNAAAAEPHRPDLVTTGISGLDQILGGGLPKGRAMMVVGGAGSGKTLLGTEFLVRGAQQYKEPGLLVSFEESIDELAANARGFGWDLARLKKEGWLYPLTIDLSGHAGQVETGDFDLEALFVRLRAGVEAVGAKRVLLDGISNLLSSFRNERTVRAELLRLFRWLKDQGLTIVVTGERGDGSWTRLGFEEYLADGLIVLDHRVEGKIAQRLLRIVKCRGVPHATDEFPFLIGKDGFSLFPIIAADLNFSVSTKRVRSGIEGLDEMLEGKGFYQGSMVLVGGSAGTGKSSVGAAFVDAACERGESAIYFAFEESPAQIIRNMRRIGIDLGRWVDNGLLTFHATRALNQGLEGHLTEMQEAVRLAKPSVAVVDPISGLAPVGNETEIKSMIARMSDYFRVHGITTMMTNLAVNGRSGEEADLAVSSLADTWILVRVIEQNAERNNVIQVLKSRGMGHSKVLREFNFTKDGIKVVDAYIGVNGAVVGSARHSQEAKDRMERVERRAEIEKKRRQLDERRRSVDTQIAALEAEYKAELEALEADVTAFDSREEVETNAVERMERERI